MATKDYAEILLETIDRVVAERFSLSYSERSEEDYEIVKTMANPYELVLPDQVSDFGGKSIAVESGKAEIGSFNFTYKDDIKYDRLIIQCELTATGPTSETTTNSYGIQVEIKENGKNYIFQFDSSEMLGNPLAFDGMLQRKICDLGEINSIDSIKLTFYNNTNKKVTFSNIKGTLGYALEDLGEAALPALIWSDVKEYHTNLEQQAYDLNKLNVNLRWIYDNGNTKKVITSSNVDELPEGVCVYWYKYTPGVPQGSDSIGGSYFSRIGTFDGSNETKPQNGFTFDIFKFIETTQDNTQIKVVICYTKEGNLTEVSSNILEIANIKDTTDERISGKQIKLEDSASGVYPFYAYDKIYAQDKIYEINKERKAVLDFDCQGKETKEQFFKDIESITWYIPNYNNEKALLLTKDSTGAYKNQLFVINNNSGQDYNEEFFALYYKLPERAIDLLPNKLKAVIKLKNGTEYEFLKDIQLAVAGDGGTDNSIIIRLYDTPISDVQPLDELESVSAITIPTLITDYYIDNFGVVISCYDFEGKIIKDNITLTLELLTYNKSNWEKNSAQISQKQNNEGQYIDTISNFHNLYALEEGVINYLKAVCIIKRETDNQNQIRIEKIVPLPFRRETEFTPKYKYIGSDRIRYNYEGQLISEKSLDISILGTDLITDNTTSFENKISVPSIKQENSNYKIIPRGLFDHVESITDNYGIIPYAIYGKSGNNIVYIQPIVIEQDVYFSRLINEWDQALKIDEANNAILSASLVAGKKDTYNKFTGIVAGDIGNIVEQTKPIKSGLFGYQAGVESFGFNTDGTAFLGQSGAGRINFNGDLGVIYSGNFKPGKNIEEEALDSSWFTEENIKDLEGTYLNLKNGLLFASDGIFKGSIYAAAGSNIAGWVTTENIFYKQARWLESGDESELAIGLETINGTKEQITQYYFGAGLSGNGDEYGTDKNVFAIGALKEDNSKWSNAKFRVTGKGKLYAADAEISGILKAGPGSNVGGWTISSPNGYVFGKILDPEGSGLRYGIGFDTNAVGKTSRALAIGLLSGIEEDSSWANADFYVTGQGKLVAQYAEINGGNIGGWDIVDSTLTRAATTNNIGNPTWTLADNIKLAHKSGTNYDTYLEFGWSIGSELADGKVYPYYGFYTNSNLAFSVGVDRMGKLMGTWTSENDLSDMRIKNSIDDYTQEYDTFFNNLRPRRYKYNNGRSNRYHTGYVAQEVVEAIESAGLTTQDFAGVMLTNPNTENECWYLRRDEFVALNTWQIQKLKAHVLELENRINKLTF